MARDDAQAHPPGGLTVMRVSVDRERCEGHARCQAIAPDVFELDENSTSRVRFDPIPKLFASQALAGVRACPVAALSADELD